MQINFSFSSFEGKWNKEGKNEKVRKFEKKVASRYLRSDCCVMYVAEFELCIIALFEDEP